MSLRFNSISRREALRYSSGKILFKKCLQKSTSKKAITSAHFFFCDDILEFDICLATGKNTQNGKAKILVIYRAMYIQTEAIHRFCPKNWASVRRIKTENEDLPSFLSSPRWNRVFSILDIISWFSSLLKFISIEPIPQNLSTNNNFTFSKILISVTIDSWQM